MILYTRFQCSACEQSKALLDSKGLDYTTINIEEHYDAAMLLVQDGIRSVPVLQMEDGTRHIGSKEIASAI